jgi:hypothetical protein
MIPGVIAAVVLLLVARDMIRFFRARSDSKKYGDAPQTQQTATPDSHSSELPSKERAEYPSDDGPRPSGWNPVGWWKR